jgi:tyrosine-protein kinase Etk/Wzc
MRRGPLRGAIRLALAIWLSEVAQLVLILEYGRQPTSLQGLDLHTHGTRGADAAELLMRPALGKALAALDAAYDHVIIDAPPILAVTDAAIIGTHAGATLLVLEAARHPLRAIDETVNRLRTAHVNLSGVVLNRVGAKAGAYGYGGYGYEYAYNYTSAPHHGRLRG